MKYTVQTLLFIVCLASFSQLFSMYKAETASQKTPGRALPAHAEILGREHVIITAIRQNNRELLNTSIRAGFTNLVTFVLVGNKVAAITPLDLAEALGASAAVALLKQHGAKKAVELPQEDITKKFNEFNAEYEGQLQLVQAQDLFHMKGK